jgi:integrase
VRREDVRIKLYRGAYYVVWRDGGETRRRALRTKDRGAAERALIDFLKTAAGPRETVAEIMEAYLDDRQHHPGLPRARDAWKRLRPHFSHLRPADVTRIECRAYTAMRRRRVKDGTIIKELATLRGALRWHDRKTTAVIEMPRLPPPRDRYLTREEYRALREAAKATPHCYAFVWLAYRTAGRATAILELTWDRVDFARGLIILAGKQRRLSGASLLPGAGRSGEEMPPIPVSQKGRATVPMADDLADVLREVKRGALTERVIEFAGKPVRSIRKTFAAAVARAGLTDVSPHVLRHSAAVHMAESGISISEISQYLGHSSSAITEKVYARFSPGYLRRASGALE